MRTTLAIDDDVLFAVKERARRERRTAGEVLSDLARQALTNPTSNRTAPPDDDDFYGFPTLPAGGRVVTNELIDRLREDGPY